MYPKFIELHWNTIPLSYNVENILWFGDKFLYIVGEDSPLDVDESYDEIKAHIKDSGCLIHKADPRLDTEHPLTMNDLMTMVGEPVWDSNDGRWYLIHWVDDSYLIAYLYSDEGVQVWRDDDTLKAKPMYRIRQ